MKITDFGRFCWKLALKENHLKLELEPIMVANVIVMYGRSIANAPFSRSKSFSTLLSLDVYT